MEATDLFAGRFESLAIKAAGNIVQQDLIAQATAKSGSPSSSSKKEGGIGQIILCFKPEAEEDQQGKRRRSVC
jgi:hypothetical protein